MIDINAYRSQIVNAIKDIFEERGFDTSEPIELSGFIPCFNIEYYSNFYCGNDTTQVGDIIIDDDGFTIISHTNEDIEVGDGDISTDELYRFYQFLNNNLEEIDNLD